MKNKPRTRNSPDKGLPDKAKKAGKGTGAEEKLQAVVQKLRNNPAIVAGTLVVTYCVVRLVFSV